MRAGGYREIELGAITVSVPAQFARPLHLAPGDRPKIVPEFLGDVAGDAIDQNFWAITHAFVYREAADATGNLTAPALLVVSRVADRQSLSHSQLIYESAARFSPDARWRAVRRLEWKQQTVSPLLSYSSAELASGPAGATVYTISDRETLIEAALIGDNAALSPAVAREVLNDLRRNYRVTSSLDDYFRQARLAEQRVAEGRRKNYLTLLQVLQREELDYTPTPRVVVFNKNLAGQFWWPLFDRSGVPSHFAIAGRLGRVLRTEESMWREMTATDPATRVLSVSGALGKPWQWTLLSGGAGMERGIGKRTQSLLQDSGWLGAAIGGEQQGFATIEFPFDRPIPDLSRWLDGVEALSRRAEQTGLVEPEKR